MNKQMKKKTPPMEDSLAPFTDGKEAEPHYTDTIDPELIKPTPKPTPPNAEPSAPGSMKMPDNTTEKIKDLDTMRSNGMDQPLTSNLGVKIANDQNTLKAGSRGPSLLEDFHFLEKWLILTRSGYRNAWFTQEVPGHMAIFRYTSPFPSTPRRAFCRIREKRPRSLCVFPTCRASEDLRIR